MRDPNKPGSDAMNAASDHSLPPSANLAGPAAAVLVALAGAALVALGLLLVGARQDSVGLRMPGAVPPPVRAAG